MLRTYALVTVALRSCPLYMDEEVERSYEEFYEDVHTEFLKFGEIVNFKVSKNGSSHLRGNVYIHYKSLDSAVVAYQSVNGRYFAGKQVTCEFIGVTKWKVAICGEYMKSRLKTCSRGTACNFIHCFRNPGGDYEWADMDRPQPKYWAMKMAALFGYAEEYGYGKHIEQEGRNYSKMRMADPYSYYRRSRSRERDSSRSCYEECDGRSSRHVDRHQSGSSKALQCIDEKNREGMSSRNRCESKNRTHNSDSDRDWPYKDRGEDRHQSNMRKDIRDRVKVLEAQDFHADRDRRDRHRVSKRESSKHHDIVLSLDNRRNKRETTHDTDCREDDRDRHHRKTRKRSGHSNEWSVLGSIDDEHDNSVRKMKNENNPKESDFEQVEPRKAKKRHKSSRRDRSSMEPSETNASGEKV